MIRTSVTKLTILSILFVLLTSCLAYAGRLETVSETIDMEDSEELIVDIEIDVANLIIRSDDMAEAAKIDLTYDTRQFDYEIDFNPRGSRGFLYLEGGSRRHTDIRRADNDWEVSISTRYPTELEMEIGACEAEIDLGGIRLTSLRMDIGAVEGVIEFSRKNPERMSVLDLDVGASDLQLVNLGNANFDELNFDCGAASVELDLRGDYEASADVSIDVGMGSTDVILPKGIPVRIDAGDDGWFSSVDFHGVDLEEVDDGIFESEDYRGAKVRLFIEVDVGMGSVDFHIK